MIQIGRDLLWFLGVAIILRAFFVGNSDILTIIATGMMLLTFGSVFILAGDQFGKEKDSNKIYAYSSCMLAIAGCIIAIIQLFKSKKFIHFAHYVKRCMNLKKEKERKPLHIELRWRIQ